MVHGILYAMGEAEMCHNERFVDAFAYLLLQYELTKEGNLLKIWRNDVTKKVSIKRRVAKK